MRHSARRSLVRLLALGALSWAASGCSATVSSGSRPEPVARRDRHGEAARLGVPPGHLPPPGECRVWYPGRPPGHQPPPTDCDRAMRRAPAGAWVLYRPDRRHVHSRVIDRRRSGVVVRVRVYEAAGGRYLRTEER
jgi:hypothetical protein